MSHASDAYVKYLQLAPNGELISPGEKAVLSTLSDYHRDDVGAAWPSMETLAGFSGNISARHCRRIIRELERKGVLETTVNINEKTGGQTSNECRFCELDPPFNERTQAMIAKRRELSSIRRANPAQGSLYPPVTDVRGGRTPTSGGDGHRGPGGADTDVRGGRTTVSAHEPLEESSRNSRAESLSEPNNPLPPTGGDAPGFEQAAWNALLNQLKEDLCSVPLNVAREKGFTEIVEGQNDFDACFRGWWPVALKRLPNGVIVTTSATENPEANRQGLKKYQKRLARLVRRFYGLPDKMPVSVLQERESVPAKEPGRQEPHFELRAQGEPERPSAAQLWAAVIEETQKRIWCIGSQNERQEAMNNFDQAIRPARLTHVEMEDAATLWTLRAPNDKKTRAVMGMLNRHISAALRMVAGGDVQIRVLGPADRLDE